MQKMERVCPRCSASFSTTDIRQIYCCRNCKCRANDKRAYEKNPRKRYGGENVAKILARNAVWAAIKKGRLVRPDSCSGCGRICRPEAHHHRGYEKDVCLDVEWLCPKCHRRADMNVATDANSL